MFFIVSYMKSFMKPEYSAIQISAMTHPYQWTIDDALYEYNIFGAVEPSFNKP